MPKKNEQGLIGKAFLVVITSLLIQPNVFSQNIQSSSATNSTSGISFDAFIKKVESETAYHFYFDKAQTDSLVIAKDMQTQPLGEALKKIFAGSDFHFAIDKENHVFITKALTLQTELPFRFFERSNIKIEDNQTADYLQSNKTTKLKTGLENKLFEIGPKTDEIKPGNAMLSGHISDIESGEPVVGAVIFSEKNNNNATATDAFGYFSFSLPKGRNDIKIKSIGMKPTKRQLILYADGKLNVEMQQDVVVLREVLIQKEKDANVTRTTMGLEKLDIKTMKQVPSVFGEVDVLRVIMALPGVQTVGENSTGLNVRGGSTDQNLILLNDATIYNPSHLFGFFSAFNPDIIKDVELYKSSIPAEYGGRLSSVLAINTRDGNKKKFGGSGGIGLLTGRLTLEGPIFKDKTSFMVSARSTYSDWLLKQVPNKTIQNSAASFYDLNAQIVHHFNDKNTLKVTGYLSKDQFRFGIDTTYSYSNKAVVAKWSHIVNNKFYGVFTGGYSGYDYSVASTKNLVNAYKLSYSLAQANVKADFHYNLKDKHFLDFGFSSTFYNINPGTNEPIGAISETKYQNLQTEKGLESALYIADKFDINTRLSIYAGLRFSMYNYLGSKTVTDYAPNLPIEAGNALGTTQYANNQIIKTYAGPEYRISAKYSITDKISVKAGYNRTRQYLNMLSNTTSIAPTDIWKLSDSYIKPQVGDQFSLGFYQNLKSSTIETSVEGYYKNINDAISYKNGANLILNPTIETDVVNAKGYAYGIEFMIKKTAGKLNGWISYTFSRSFVQINQPENNTVVNQGNYFPTNYDKPHSVNFIGNYKFNHRFSISVNIVYSTGRPITLPDTKYQIDGVERFYYSNRNEYRVADYFRTDLSLNIEGNHKIKKLAHSSWSLGVYNLTGRQNVYSVYFQNVNGVLKGYTLSIFGSPIPTITYNFKF